MDTITPKQRFRERIEYWLDEETSAQFSRDKVRLQTCQSARRRLCAEYKVKYGEHYRK